MDKKKILSSLTLAGILTASVLGANVNAATANEYLKPVGVYKKLIEGENVVPYVLKEKNKPVTIKDVKAEFKNLTLVNGNAVTNESAELKTGDTFTANNVEYTIVVYGDVNKDGKINTRDALMAQKMFLGEEVSKFQEEAADVVNNGKVNTRDALAIQKYVLNGGNVIDVLPKIEDNTAPVLNGIPTEKTIYVKLGNNEYTLPTVTAIDDVDGEVQVTVYGKVDINKEGTYKIKYTAKDSNGNTATDTLEIIVDGKAPVLSENLDGKTQYVNMKDSECKLPELTATDNGEIIPVTKVIKINNTVIDSIDVNTDGTYTVTYTAEDKVGNVAKTELTVVVDKTVPKFDESLLKTQYVNLGDTTYVLPELKAMDNEKEVETTKVIKGADGVELSELDVKVAGTYTVIYTAKDLAGNEASVELTVVVDNEGPIFEEYNEIVYVKKSDETEAIYALPELKAVDTVDGDIENITTSIKKIELDKQEEVESIDITKEGKYVVTYTATDSLENSTQATLTIIVDGTAPIVNVDYDVTIATNQDVRAIIVSNEEIKIPEGWEKYEPEQNEEETEYKMFISKAYGANITEEVTIEDLAGNKTKATIIINNIDKTAPEVDGIENNGVYGENDTVKAEFTEGSAILYVLDEEDNETQPKSYVSGDIVVAEGVYKLVVKDAAGNQTAIKFTIDLTDPVFDGLNDEGNLETLTLSEENIANIEDVIKVTADNGTIEAQMEITCAGEKVEEIAIDKNADYEITYTATDLAGNSSTITRTVKVDITKPEASVTYNTKNPSRNVIVSIAFDKEMQISEELTNAGWTLSEDKLTMSKIYEENVDASVNFKDLAGNSREVSILINNIDTKAPIIQTISGISETLTNEDVKVTITVNEKIQETKALTSAGWTLLEDGMSIEKIYTSNATETVVLRDLAGNETSKEIKVANIDKEAPTPTVTFTPEDTTNKEVKVTVKANKELQLTEELTNAGWVLSVDKMSIEKTYTANAVETIVLKDIVGNETSKEIKVENIDKEAPIIEGVKNNKSYNVDVTITCNEDNIKATLQKGNNEAIDIATDLKTGKTVSQEGSYVLIVEDALGNKDTIIFSIDKTKPVITDVEEGKSYKEVTPKFNEGVAVLKKIVDGQETSADYAKGDKIVEDGEYILTVSDVAGNSNSVSFIIDNVKPTITNIEEGKAYKVITPVSTDTDIAKVKLTKKGEEPIEVDTLDELGEIANAGKYYLEVEDNAGNVTIINFVIDNEVELEDPAFITSNNGELVKDSVIVTIKALEELELTEALKNDGWKIAPDGRSIYKTYIENTTDSNNQITVQDKIGNTKVVTIEVTGIDVTTIKVAGTTYTVKEGENDVTYDPTTVTKEAVTVTITATKEIKLTTKLQNAGWVLAEDKMSISKVYENHTDVVEEVELEDLVGNKVKTEVVALENIYDANPTITGTYAGDTEITAGSSGTISLESLKANVKATDVKGNNIDAKNINVKINRKIDENIEATNLNAIDLSARATYVITYTATDVSGRTATVVKTIIVK